MNWYVLYTVAKAERRVEDRIRLEGIETYVPIHLQQRRWSDRVKTIEIPLFTSYVFVRTTDEKLRTMTSLYGVSRIVYYNRAPAIVRPHEIEAIKQFCCEAALKECVFLTNDEVIICCGALNKTSGRIIKIKNNRLILCIESLGINLSVLKDQVIKKKWAVAGY